KEEKLSSSSTSTKNLVNNFKYLLELILFVLIPITPFILCLFFDILLFYRVYLIYPKLLLSEADYITKLNPFEIMFSQSTINNIFQMGNCIDNTINDLVDGKVKIEDFPMLQVCIIDDI